MPHTSTTLNPACYYWVCDNCQRINDEDIRRCEICRGTAPERAHFLPLELARQAADEARVDTLLRATLPAIRDLAESLPDFVRPVSNETALERVTGETWQAPASDRTQPPPQPIPVRNEREDTLRIVDNPFARTVSRPTARKAFHPRPSRRQRTLPITELQFYSLTVLITCLLLGAWLFWVYAPRSHLVTVKHLYWSASLPLEEALMVEMRPGALADGSLVGNWTVVDHFKSSGISKDTYLPQVYVPKGNYRLGLPSWSFMVTFIDENNVSYPEFYSEEDWRNFDVGQHYQAKIKNGRIIHLQPLNHPDQPAILSKSP